MINLQNIEKAFQYKSISDLKKSYWLFKMINYPTLVKIGKWKLNFALKIGFPIKWIVKPTVFKQFCGGETIEECQKTINTLGKYNVKTILDYSKEGAENDISFEETKNEIISTIEKAKVEKNISFAVFKMTGIAEFNILEKASKSTNLRNEDLIKYQKTKQHTQEICEKSYQEDIPIFIDAEETWIQSAIDNLAYEMMLKFNQNKTIVFNTLQLYRNDRIEYLKNIINKAKRDNIKLGFKLVRGAYMEKERERAVKLNYPSPINNTKQDTDNIYNEAIKICIENIDIVSICIATHNEESTLYALDLMAKSNISSNDNRIHFAQLLGMSDNISFNLSNEGFNASKYVPYGPVKDVMPYLIRRAQENTSVAGQTGRELSLISNEIKRRRSLK